MKNDLDDLDRKILAVLLVDARSSARDIATSAGVSPPTIRDRIRRMEDTGLITGFSVDLSPEALGYSLTAIVRFRALPGKKHQLEDQIAAERRIVQCDKVTGEDGFAARVLLRQISELDPFLETFSRLATTHTSIVKSSPVNYRAPQI